MPEGAAGESEGFWGSGVLGGGRGASLSGPTPRGPGRTGYSVRRFGQI
jgi:hypothetical protein